MGVTKARVAIELLDPEPTSAGDPAADVAVTPVLDLRRYSGVTNFGSTYSLRLPSGRKLRPERPASRILPGEASSMRSGREFRRATLFANYSRAVESLVAPALQLLTTSHSLVKV